MTLVPVYLKKSHVPVYDLHIVIWSLFMSIPIVLIFIVVLTIYLKQIRSK
jgi:hypothetical protein